MGRGPQRTAALVVCLLVAALELLSTAPSLHRHNEGLGALLGPVQADDSRPVLTLPSKSGGQDSRDCPVCRISGLYAVVSCGIPVATPAAQPRAASVHRVAAVPLPFVACTRGRAPPAA